MHEFNRSLKNIKERANAYLDFKQNYKLTHDKHDISFWRNRRLVSLNSWDYISKEFPLKKLLKFMPEKLEIDPLDLKNDSKGEYFAEYDEWLMDYMEYLAEHCGETRGQVLWDKICGLK